MGEDGTVVRRGDNIPSVSDYSHWNEDAQRIWYEENKYDMQHWDEEVSDGMDEPPEEEPDDE